MVTLIYDGTFDGILTAVFEVFEYRYQDVSVISQQNYLSENMFAEKHEVFTDHIKSQRVLNKLEQNIGKAGCSDLLKLFFSEHPQMEDLFLYVVKRLVQSPEKDIMQNFADERTFEISKILKSMRREIHRMHAFVRFERMQDDVYFAKVEPDFNVLPLIFKHFKVRYADQKWMIVDIKRNFGVFYDLENVHFFVPEEDQRQNFLAADPFRHDEENHFQAMWQKYFIRTGITSRKNMKLHIQHVPKRYWKYLTEKA